MDPLSVTASVIAILQLTNEAIQYLNDVKHAPKEVQQCVIEASNLLGPLVSLRYCAEQAQISDPWFEQLRKLNVKDGPLDQYKEALELLITRVEVGDGIQKIKRRLLWKFTKEEVAGILARMERLKGLVSVALQMDHRKLSDAIKNDTSSILASLPPLQASVDNIEASVHNLQIETRAVQNITLYIRDALSPLQASTTAVRDAQGLQYHQAVLEWLSPIDTPAQYHDVISRRQAGTAQWFLESPKFKEWLHGPNKTLFCPGIPGAGKTMMAAVAIDHLCRTTHSTDVGIAYLFCSYQAQVDQTVPNLLATLLKQLVQSRLDIAAPVMGLYDLHTKRHTKPSLNELMQALLSICSSCSSVYFVIDALDECSNTNGVRRQLIDKLCSFQDSSHVRLLFTSRFIPEVTERFGSTTWLEVRASDEDVRCFVTGQIPRLCIPTNDQLHSDIESKIVEAVDGMFLLARLHVDTLVDQVTPKQVRATLAKLRKGSEALPLAYKKALDRIEGQAKNHCKLARQTLSWMTFAQRPITTNELRHALAIEPHESALDHENMTDIGVIISVCAGLVTVDEESGIIRLVHYTTQEYLERIQLEWNPVAQEEIAVACLTYLSFDTFQSGSCTSDIDLKQRLADNPFFDYSARYWSDHIRLVERSSSVVDLALAFLNNNSIVNAIIQAIAAEDHRAYKYSNMFPSRTTGLHLTATYGLLDLTEKLLVRGTDSDKIEADSKNSNDATPLLYASVYGHEAVVKLLLDAGADVKAQGGKFGNTLYYASVHGHEAVVKLLLDAGADVNARGGEYGNALYAASYHGYKAVVKLLLDAGADVNARSGKYCRALSVASYHGHEAVVKLLLDASAHVNAQGGKYGSALYMASIDGDEAVVKLLLDAGADVKVQGGRCRNALQVASASGNESVVKLLLDAGADVNAQGGRYGNALQAASGSGNEAVVKLLLDSGADVNAQGGRYGNALQAASGSGNEAVVRLLLDSGADIKAQDSGEYGNALQAASGSGNEAVVKLLLDSGADIKAQGSGEYGSALQAASHSGHEAVVKLLLDSGADVNAQGGLLGNALQEASYYGHEVVVKLLLDSGADINAQGGLYSNALQAALLYSNEAIVKLLLDAGAIPQN